MYEKATQIDIFFLFDIKKSLLFETRRLAMTLCVERWGEGADL